MLDIFFPPYCASCNKIGAYLCRDCARDVRYFDFSICPVCDRPTVGGKAHEVCVEHARSGLDGMIALARYEEPVSSLIKMMKYGGVKDAGREIYSMCTLHWPSWAPQFDCLVPIPLHPKKKRMRGFNQAEEIARYIAGTTNTPVVKDVLIKVRETAFL